MKKNQTIILILIISLVFIFSACEFTEEEDPTPNPTLEPTPYPYPKVAGDVWVLPEFPTVAVGVTFILNVYLNSGTQKFAAYGIDFTYNPIMLDFVEIDDAPDGYITAYNENIPGKIETTGMDLFGTGPGENLHILEISFTAISGPYSEIDVSINLLVDESIATIGVPHGIGGVVNITGK